MSLPAHVGRKLALSGWFEEDGRGNTTRVYQKPPSVYLINNSHDRPQPIEPAWKPSEPIYNFKLDM